MAKAKKQTLTYYEGIGRRKSAVVRLRLFVAKASDEIPEGSLKVKKGQHVVNASDMKEYFTTGTLQASYVRPFELTDTVDRFAVISHVQGGGKAGQAEAAQLAAARALEKVDPTFRTVLKAEGVLSRDPRVRESRKPGTGGKARRQKQSPKR